MTTSRTAPPIREWKDGLAVDAYAFVSFKQERTDRHGRTYVQLELRDASGSMTGFVWPDSAAGPGDFELHQFVAVAGSVQRYREDLQLNVRSIRPVTEMDRAAGFDEGRLVQSSAHDLGEMWQRLTAIVESSIDEPLLRQVAEFALDRWGDDLRTHPAAKSIHHAFRGGLLEHVLSMAELGVAIADHYPEIDRDLVLIGVLFHDLGKVRELGPMPANDYTPEGRFVGHIVLGRDMLREACDAVGGIPETTRLRLEHLVLSHHGRQEWGTPVEPMTGEALVLHMIDDLDSKLGQLRSARAEGTGFRFLRPMSRFVWLGD